MNELQNIVIPLLTGLIGFLGSAWVDSKNRDKDNFNQLSNNTYQKLFDRKIDTYNKLASISFKFTKFDVAYSGSIELADIEARTKKILIHKHYHKIYEAYIQFENIIQEDFIILSPALGSSYLEWQVFLYSESKELLQSKYQIHASKIDYAFDILERKYRVGEVQQDFQSQVNDAHIDSHELKSLIVGELVELHSDKFNLLVEQIKKDISEMIKRINNFNL